VDRSEKGGRVRHIKEKIKRHHLLAAEDSAAEKMAFFICRITQNVYYVIVAAQAGPRPLENQS
jgi:hypothetical protein